MKSLAQLQLKMMELEKAWIGGSEDDIHDAIQDLRIEIFNLTIAKQEQGEPDVSSKLKYDFEFVDGTVVDLTVYGSERDIKRLQARIKFWFDLEQKSMQQEQGEHVAVVDANDDRYWADILPNRSVKVGQLLYPAPPKHFPLTDEQERAAFAQHWYDFYHCGSISAGPSGTYVHPDVQKAWEAWQARAAHGIKGGA